jgi:hypothetical protein
LAKARRIDDGSELNNIAVLLGLIAAGRLGKAWKYVGPAIMGQAEV